MEKSSQQISILDLNTAAFLSMHGLEPQLSMQGGRVVFNFQADAEFYKLSSLYNDNLSVGCLDFVQALKKMRGKMLNMKEHTGNGNGVKNGNFNR
ncbi:MAG: DUF5659 domain-containing protein [Proteobacteria bacterium]|nr:DUF5659 domain-containing protein [Pseudomonadota bacterium]